MVLDFSTDAQLRLEFVYCHEKLADLEAFLPLAAL